METFITKLLHMPPVAAEHGHDLDKLMLYVHLLMFALFVGWSAFFVYTVVRFRQRRSPTADHAGVQSHSSTWLEGAVALVEAVLLVGFAIPLWARGAAPANFPKESEAVVIRVIGRQFNWIARYPGADGVFGKADPKLLTAENPLGLDAADPHGKDDVSVENSDMYAPVNKPVIIHLSSLDVIHCFAIKPMRITQDVIPGLSIPIWFKPTVLGTYQINCAQLCGIGHSTMRGLLHVVTAEEYDAWLKKKAKAGPSAASYE